MNKKQSKNVKNFNKFLSKLIKDQEVVTVERDLSLGIENIGGLLLDKSDELLLIHETDEFLLNGFAVVRLDQFESISCNEFDKTYKRILKKEGILEKKSGLKGRVKLKNWRSLFKYLKKNGLHAIIECELKKSPSFFIGPIKKAGKSKVVIHNYDALGRLDPKATKVNYDHITTVRFGNRYTTIFGKYLKKS